MILCTSIQRLVLSKLDQMHPFNKIVDTRLVLSKRDQIYFNIKMTVLTSFKTEVIPVCCTSGLYARIFHFDFTTTVFLFFFKFSCAIVKSEDRTTCPKQQIDRNKANCRRKAA